MDQIELVPMTEEEFAAWAPAAVAAYARENVASGRWSEEEAPERSRKEHAQLLPEGVATPDHHLWTIVRSADHQRVGMIWINAVRGARPHAWIYNIEIDERFRRKGYAEQAMIRLEEEVRNIGLETIRLHVFAHNSAARPLYEKLGYVETNINMAKHLDRG